MVMVGLTMQTIWPKPSVTKTQDVEDCPTFYFILQIRTDEREGWWAEWEGTRTYILVADEVVSASVFHLPPTSCIHVSKEKKTRKFKGEENKPVQTRLAGTRMSDTFVFHK